MKITQHDQLFQLSFMPRLFPVNCYLIEETDRLTLIDAALPYSAKSIIKTAQQIGKPIANIILTHAHNDHIGSLDTLKTLIPNVQVSISARDFRLLKGDTTLLENEPTTPIRGGIPKKVQTKPDRLLKDGDLIGSLEVITAPGHTPGSIALLDTRNGHLIAGDAFQIRGGIAVSGVLKPAFPFPAFATWNKQVAVDSAKKLVNLNPSLLAVGHGQMIEQPVQIMKQAIEEASRLIEMQ
ncbi:MBL fold metallo-hydrolase [Rummeliibacillus pycnus]|uniref:MBL fold metallo-hydrolase n=1 Tax=Rummeliibacillus pycnus TaxID=101070 RepID=UPI000C9C332A|nr:MBL fold metallo-hydrolase [Rummeliibacillus pycnus]